MVGMARRTEFLHQDPGLISGAPSIFRARWPHPGARPVGPGGTNALLVAIADGTVHAYGSNGKDLPGWPVHTGPDTGFHPGEEAYRRTRYRQRPGGDRRRIGRGDLADASGHDLDVVATDLTGRVWAWNAGGLCCRLAGADRSRLLRSGRHHKDNEVLRGILGAPVLGDLQGNGTLDVVAASMDRHVYAWQPGGEVAPGWPVDVVDPNEVQSVDPSDGHVTFLPGARGTPGPSSSTPRPSPNSCPVDRPRWW